MFAVTEQQAAAIRDAFRLSGELSAVVELRRMFPGITDVQQARECVRIIAGWKALPARRVVAPPPAREIAGRAGDHPMPLPPDAPKMAGKKL
jgi:hypothetical protein